MANKEQNVKKVGIIGYGTVGSGVYEALQLKRTKLEKLLGGTFEVPVILVNNMQRDRGVKQDTLVTDNFDEIASRDDLDLVVEATPDAETAYPYVRELLQKGVTVVSANKELIAKHGDELLALAKDKNCRLFFEAAVAGGVPILTSIRHTLKTNHIERIEAVVNGTSNFILTKMRKEGASFENALKEAQEKGYAEAVPDKDVDGWDAYYKTTLLSQWIYGKAPLWSNNHPIGVRHIDVRDLQLAEQLGGRVKHVASLDKKGDQVIASVQPRFVLADHPLHAVEGVDNGIHVEGSLVGSLLFQGPGAGKFPTASAILEEVVNYWTNTSEAEPLNGLEFEPTTDATAGEDAEDNEGVWLVTGVKLSQQLKDQNTVKVLTSIQSAEGREGAIVTGEEFDIHTVVSKFNEPVAFYPVCGDHADAYNSFIAQGQPVS